MSEFIFKLPDLGEGTVEAEIILWHVKPGDVIREGQLIVDVMTDKANIEVPAPKSGRVLRTSGNPGDMITVGTELIAIETDVNAAVSDTPPKPVAAPPLEPVRTPADVEPATAPPGPAHTNARVMASPALRKLASEKGIDLATVTGSGPRGRILRKDIEAAEGAAPAAAAPTVSSYATDTPGEVTEIKVIGVRRVIAERMQAAKREIPHFAYVEEIDMTALESLRVKLNARDAATKLTFLPFIAIALMRALKTFPQCNAHFDAQNGTLRRFSSVHLGVATQTPDGLKVPVVHHADRLSLNTLAAAIQTVTEKARSGTATRQELTGSTITLTSLGKLGGIASTPIINAPEMGIIGVNKAVQRPMVIDGQVEIRLMMNLSSSFDHRFIDGYDAASMIQAMKGMLEEPALLFLP
jgi:2-oxoisovalerate dehydrogenase E2 component (dihydrolipoyl transacylase)